MDFEPELLGVSVTESFDILMIHDDGLIAKHNSECHPDKIVIPGDRMTAVNGQRVNTLPQFIKVIQQKLVLGAIFLTFERMSRPGHGQFVTMIRGFISHGDDLMKATITVAQAKRIATQMFGCRGFCFTGVDTGQAVEVRFKSKFDNHQSMTEVWTSYKIQSEESVAALESQTAEKIMLLKEKTEECIVYDAQPGDAMIATEDIIDATEARTPIARGTRCTYLGRDDDGDVLLELCTPVGWKQFVIFAKHLVKLRMC